MDRTSYNARFTTLWHQFPGAFDVAMKLKEMGVPYPAKLKGDADRPAWTENEYKTLLIEILIANQQRIA